ncbi:MAG TPA: Crp/Fnr family transcriptional regulator [Mesotoga infera]|uniref:Crp/Fnr family transcriptional regulator n=1 Tax=Mesotoga infera TaxID=1236046 RepID=A0A117LU38_9BACT|nr:MAG: cAMP-binding protein [Mesotoga infera]KUK89676.1 MAG: cAMP-binding protein [Mesotoga infera]HCO70362.1 Crp/Fnr family transcriptional regulator [Mesotoga infera]
MNPLIYNLGRCSLFEGIKVGQLERIFENVNHRITSFLAGELIEEQNSPCDEMLILLQGHTKAQMQDFSGKVITIETMEAPSILASGFLFASKNVIPVDIVSTDNCAVLYIERDGILWLCREYEVFLRNLLRDMGDRLATLAEKVWMLSLNTLNQRLANFLLKQSDDLGSEFELKTTKEELADALGVARPSLSRVFSEFVAEKIIRQEGKLIKILDRKALKKITGRI